MPTRDSRDTTENEPISGQTRFSREGPCAIRDVKDATMKAGIHKWLNKVAESNAFYEVPVEGDDEEMPADRATQFRSVCARLNFLAQDRPELAYSAKQLARDVLKPTRRSVIALKACVSVLAWSIQNFFGFHLM